MPEGPFMMFKQGYHKLRRPLSTSLDRDHLTQLTSFRVQAHQDKRNGVACHSNEQVHEMAWACAIPHNCMNERMLDRVKLLDTLESYINLPHRSSLPQQTFSHSPVALSSATNHNARRTLRPRFRCCVRPRQPQR
ncbi:hypothetical protein PTI98_003369 [Pleurotus ostreatus]|nr:hypothetical protein PTI98_003369 [Pleurotus ostreatus]